MSVQYGFIKTGRLFYGFRFDICSNKRTKAAFSGFKNSFQGYMPLKFTLIFSISLLLIRYGTAQSCTTLGQTASTAFPICGTSSFVQVAVPTCVNGNILVDCPANGNTYQDL